MDEVMRETKEERDVALVATDTLEEAVGDLRLAGDTYTAILQERENAVVAREQQASWAEGSLRQREEAVEARAKELDEQASSLPEREAVVHRVLEQRAQELEARVRAVDAREAKLEEHESMAANAEAILQVAEEVNAERAHALADSKAVARQLDDGLRLREEA
uniref:Uncharacterized protein n=1 Tax=Oryza punctata TaxID=4537 RepID=A0A0E0MFP7_ORYPU